MFRFSDEAERTMNQIYNQFPGDVYHGLLTLDKALLLNPLSTKTRNG